MGRWQLPLVGLMASILLTVSQASARQSPAAIVIDANTGATLHESAADGRRFPASLTKMMTLYLVFEQLRQRRLSLATPIRFSRRASSQQPSKLGLAPGETIAVRDAISALITKSANDVATAVAEHIAGTEAAFARRMTAKARELGMSRTIFRNASGLPDRLQVTTARDMARLGLALQDHFPKRYRMFAQRRFAFRGRRYKNHNRLLGRFPGTDGIKTGYTRASGFNVTTSVRRNGKHVVGVVIGQRTGRVRDAIMRKLLVKALAKASRRRTRRSAPRPPALVARPQLVAKNPRTVRPRPFLPRASARRRPPAPRIYRRSAQARGRRPSTFADQAAGLSTGNRTALPAPRRVDRRARSFRSPASLPRHATHQVQIGAFFSDVEARNALSRAQRQAGPILRGFQAVSVKVSSSPRPIYRARFAGFSPSEAAATCSRLKTVRVDCFVARAN